MRNHFDRAYLALVSHVMLNGEKRETRAGPTRQIFGTTFHTDVMRQGKFPILTTRKIFYKPVLGELAAFLQGATELSTFHDYGCKYWDANAEAWEYNQERSMSDYYVGNIYGAKWRNWPIIDQRRPEDGLDQLAKLVDGLKRNPMSRRHVITAYDPAEEWQCLPPCHLMAQFNVDNAGFLDCIVYMRSVDLCLGLPSDVILYASLMILIAHQTNYKPGTLSFMLADTHIYENHVEVFKKQLASPSFDLPTWDLFPEATIDNFEPKYLELFNYFHGDRLEYPFAV